MLARIAAVEESARDRDRERDLGKAKMLYILRNFQLNIYSSLECMYHILCSMLLHACTYTS